MQKGRDRQNYTGIVGSTRDEFENGAALHTPSQGLTVTSKAQVYCYRVRSIYIPCQILSCCSMPPRKKAEQMYLFGCTSTSTLDESNSNLNCANTFCLVSPPNRIECPRITIRRPPAHIVNLRKTCHGKEKQPLQQARRVVFRGPMPRNVLLMVNQQG